MSRAPGSTIGCTVFQKMAMIMAAKAAKVTACVLPEIRLQAADVVECVGLFCINIDRFALSSDHRDRSIPYPLADPALQTKDTMAIAQFDEIMQRGLIQAAFRCCRCFPRLFQSGVCRCWLFHLAFRYILYLKLTEKSV